MKPDETKTWVKIDGVKHATVLVDGVRRFPVNRVVKRMELAAREGRKYDMNDVSRDFQDGAFTKAEVMEFSRLTGCSLCHFADGFGQLNQPDEPWFKKMVDSDGETYR